MAVEIASLLPQPQRSEVFPSSGLQVSTSLPLSSITLFSRAVRPILYGMAVDHVTKLQYGNEQGSCKGHMAEDSPMVHYPPLTPETGSKINVLS